MNRVVLDTNVVSALLVPAGTQASVLLLAFRGSIALCVSAPVMEEYEEVLRRPRLKLQPRAIDTALRDIRRVDTSSTPPRRLRFHVMHPTTGSSNVPRQPKRTTS